ncbi:MAG: DUF2141 domain-containing protein [Novosphingobium sp.]
MKKGTAMQSRSIAAIAIATLGAVGAMLAPVTAPAMAQSQYRQHIANDLSKCSPGQGPAVRVTVNGIRSSSGMIRVQSYRGTAADWLQKGRWINRIETPARSGSMTFCVPVPDAGVYGIAVRHDTDGDGKTSISRDGGGMSNNPSLNIFNLGKPSHTKTAFNVGNGVKAIQIDMKYR